MRDERNGEAVVAASVAERIAADTVAAVDEHIAAAALLERLLPHLLLLIERLLPHLPTAM